MRTAELATRLEDVEERLDSLPPRVATLEHQRIRDEASRAGERLVLGRRERLLATALAVLVAVSSLLTAVRVWVV